MKTPGLEDLTLVEYREVETQNVTASNLLSKSMLTNSRMDAMMDGKETNTVYRYKGHEVVEIHDRIVLTGRGTQKKYEKSVKKYIRTTG